VIEIDGLPLRAIVNRALRDSYQVNSAVVISQVSDQSLMLHQLPPLRGKEEYDFSLKALRARRAGIEKAVDGIFTRALQDPETIKSAFAEIGFRMLADRLVRFHCPCSHDRMIHNIRLACSGEYDELFDPGQSALKIRCDYCKSHYSVSRDDLESAVSPMN
jgi:redox-regulated HSP33 family molecular chaperone